MAALSFDEEFQRRRIRRRREAGGAGTNRRGGHNGAQGAARMLVHAVRDLGGGVYHGVTGIIVEPYCRARVSTSCVLRESGNEEKSFVGGVRIRVGSIAIILFPDELRTNVFVFVFSRLTASFLLQRRRSM